MRIAFLTARIRGTAVLIAAVQGGIEGRLLARADGGDCPAGLGSSSCSGQNCRGSESPERSPQLILRLFAYFRQIVQPDKHDPWFCLWRRKEAS